MLATVDIAVCIDHTASITSDYPSICRMVSSISKMPLRNNQNNVRMALIKFRSGDDAMRTQICQFTQDRRALAQWLSADQPSGGTQDKHEAVGDALREALNLQWRTNIHGQVSVEKLVILITEGGPGGIFSQLTGEDPWALSKEFKRQGITLAVVGIEPSICVWDDFYCALAFNTGGKYIPFVNAERIFVDVIESVVCDRSTFLQAFSYLITGVIDQRSLFKYKHVKYRVDGMMNECETMADIRRYFYSHLN